MPSKTFKLSHQVVLHHRVVLSHRVSMVSHKVVLSGKVQVVLSWQALFRVPQVVSLPTSGGCGHGHNLGTVSLPEPYMLLQHPTTKFNIQVIPII